MVEFEFLVGNDNGNSEQDIVINGELITSPNVHAKISSVPNLEELKEDYIAKNINDNLIATIESPALNNGVPSSYYIGGYATKTGKILKNIEVGAINSKSNSDIPLVNTLGHIAGFAVKKAYLDDPTVAEIEVNVDMITGLPVTQYSKDNADLFSSKFLKGHKVIIYLGVKKVNVKIKFNFIKVLPEGVPTVFYLKSLKEDSEVFKCITEEFFNDYKNKKISPKGLFDKKKIQHISIGEGTTEYPQTEDVSFKTQFINGSNNGVGHAINAVLQKFIRTKNLTKFARQDFSEALKDSSAKYHLEASEMVQSDLEDQASVILDISKQEIGKANNDIDFIVVYGGGSILMKKFLKDELMDFAKAVDVLVLYIPAKFAVIIEALGMYEFFNTKIYKILKKESKSASQQQQ